MTPTLLLLSGTTTTAARTRAPRRLLTAAKRAAQREELSAGAIARMPASGSPRSSPRGSTAITARRLPYAAPVFRFGAME
jgi:hypothetical protein